MRPPLGGFEYEPLGIELSDCAPDSAIASEVPGATIWVTERPYQAYCPDGTTADMWVAFVHNEDALADFRDPYMSVRAIENRVGRALTTFAPLAKCGP